MEHVTLIMITAFYLLTGNKFNQLFLNILWNRNVLGFLNTVLTPIDVLFGYLL